MNQLRTVSSIILQQLRKLGILLRAFTQAVFLGVLELISSERGRRWLGLLGILGICVGLVLSRPIQLVEPGVLAIRLNRVTASASTLSPGWAVVLPGIHRLQTYPVGDRVYRPSKGDSATGRAPYQTSDGLSIGVDVTVRYTLDPASPRWADQGLPSDLGTQIIEPVIDAILHRILARHTVREIYTTQRTQIETDVTQDLAPLLAPDGVIVRAVFIGRVDLPGEYRAGLQALLQEELATQKMTYTLELKERQVKESELVALADKARREKAAEAAAQEEIIAARAREEAMKHILPLKEREIEQSRLEAEASRVTRLRMAETEAEARKIEAEGEAAYRRKLAEADAYRIEQTGKANSDQMERDSALIAKNPLLIQKTLADKLSDKIQVVIAPPEAGGFFASGLIQQPKTVSNTSTEPNL